MKRLLIFIAFVAASSGCGEPEQLATRQGAALGPGYCNPYNTVSVPAAGTSWLQLSDGNCQEVYAVDNRQAWTALGGASIDRIHLGVGTSVTLCDHANATGVPGGVAGPFPCWYSGQVGNNHERLVRGPAVRWFVGDALSRPASMSVTSGDLAPPLNCPYVDGSGPPPTAFSACGTTSESGAPNYTANYCPAGCQISGQWPDGQYGAPCTAYLNGQRIAINYACPAL